MGTVTILIITTLNYVDINTKSKLLLQLYCNCSSSIFHILPSFGMIWPSNTNINIMIFLLDFYQITDFDRNFYIIFI